MLEALLIKNFQSHEILTLDLNFPITTIVGSTGAGKSAVIRALKWLCFNKPSGSSFVGRWGKADFALVGVKIDGHRILRKRGDGVNQYKLDGHRLVAFKTEPPSSISDLLNVDQINFQFQHDSTFLLSLSAPQAGRELNGVVNLEAIDRALANAASQVRETKAAVTVSTDRLSTTKDRADSLAWVVELDQQLTELESIDQERQEYLSSCDRIAQDLSEIDRWTRLRRVASEAVQSGLNAIQVAEEILDVSEQIDSIESYLAEFTQFAQLITIDLPDLVELNDFRTVYENEQQKIRSLESALSGLTHLEHAAEMAEMEYEVARKNFKKVSKICPTCLRPFVY